MANYFIICIRTCKRCLLNIVGYVYRINQNSIWRQQNKHNTTTANLSGTTRPFPLNKVTVGNYTYANIKALSFSPADEGLSIGHFCSIADDVVFMLGGGHNYKRFTSFPIDHYFAGVFESESKGKITIEDDVWIGTQSIIMSGVTLAQGTVVAAGSVVTKNTEPYSIVGGVPAKIIKYRFNKNVIEQLCSVDFSRIDKKLIQRNLSILQQNVDESNVFKIINVLPHKKK